MAKLTTRVVVAMAALVLGVGGSQLITNPAMAAVTSEHDNGVQVSAPNTSGMFCMGNRPPSTPQAYACWEPDGDYWYVKDNSADGHSAGAVWEDNDCPTSACDHLHRKGICRNPYGNGTWARCNKDYTESHQIWFTAATLEAFDTVDEGLWVSCPKQWPCHVTA
jgi:hypothetical protein